MFFNGFPQVTINLCFKNENYIEESTKEQYIWFVVKCLRLMFLTDLCENHTNSQNK